MTVTIAPLTLAQAQAIVTGTLAEARGRNARPLAVVVLDAGAHPVAFAREDGASLYRFDIARAKAEGAVGMDADTAILAERAKGNPVFFQSVSAAVGGRIAFSAGGVVIRDAGGALLGAVGVSGDTGECDAECALSGIRLAGLGRGAGA
ncbi:heme-binding protein [Novosphingobium sp. P6W]|uniref:GlcG/HbpS family heme-binding protein n=1 Tax=Novosphingobium sp. P6W TaxID=1609758 RepID=UPI0005C2F32C|nr:heme-binding protein [Novosphingobium sp. P6W]AXB78752.1 heme-binding protein [Novosphingobium sp. P6W]KIS31765.1 GlcG protein [Novosphingobium sp. P6W]